METKTIPATVYAELSPNPATMKFVVNKLLVEGSLISDKSLSSFLSENAESCLLLYLTLLYNWLDYLSDCD